MNNGPEDFHKRLERLEKAKRVSVRGNPHGPRTGVYDFKEEKRGKRRGFPWRRMFITLVLAWLALIGIKAYIANDMGEEAYQERISELSNGDQYDQIAAMLISRGPIMALFEEYLFGGVGSEKETTPRLPTAAPENEQ